MIPSGAIEDCGSSPSALATFLAGSEEIAEPSSSTDPAAGLSIRESARSSVDLPQAFGPTMTVKEWSGMATERFSAMTRWS